MKFRISKFESFKNQVFKFGGEIVNVPPEITYRGVDKTDAIDALVNEKIAKLEKFCNYISSCNVAIEKIHDRPKSGSPYRVRIDVTVPPSHEFVAENSSSEGKQYEPLNAAIRDAFEDAITQVRKLTERQQQSDKAKSH